MLKTIQNRSKKLGAFLVPFRQASMKQTPDQYIVCAIPRARATAKMVVSEEYIVHSCSGLRESFTTADFFSQLFG
jgi:hypothetical protein